MAKKCKPGKDFWRNKQTKLEFRTQPWNETKIQIFTEIYETLNVFERKKI